MKEKNTNKGITLIALIITIIVMLILVAVTITMAVNGGLFDYAGKAAGRTNAALKAEQELTNLEADMTIEELIDKYTGGATGELPAYSADLLDNTTKVLKTNAKYEDGHGKEAIIPRGFKLLLNIEDEISKGIVIQDVDGNEFVWIPVTVTGETQAEKEVSFDAIRKKFGEFGTMGVEPYANGYTGGNGEEEASDYNLMRTSVIQNGGFYIGRFEAGTITPRENYLRDDDTITEEQRTSQMVVRRDVYPYNYVGWGSAVDNYTSNVIYYNYPGYGTGTYCDQGKGAMFLSKQMYQGKDVGVTSTLCYGVQWDAMLDFIDDEKDVLNSVTWGNYRDSSLTISRTTAKYYENNQWHPVTESGYPKIPNSSILLTTGADDSLVAKNIFDVAGNCSEWTNESFADVRRFPRGGNYSYSETVSAASDRKKNFTDVTLSMPAVGFRPALYIS